MNIRVLFLCFVFFSQFAYAGNQHEYSKHWPSSIILADNPKMDVVMVEKEKQKLYVLENTGDGFKNVMEFKCSTGKKMGDKMIAGDSKTPEGVYMITGHYPDKYLSAVYGSRAFTLDYPNFIDKLEGKKGYNIWIHGTNKPQLKDRDTNGCVALANSDIEILKKKIKVGETPVIIVKKIDFTTKDKVASGVGKELNSFFKRWLLALEKGSYHDYLDQYSDNYLPEISWWPDWITKRKKIEEKFVVKANNLTIFSEENGRFYSIWFTLGLSSGKLSEDAGKIKLFVKKEGKGYKIFGDEVAEKFSNLPLLLSKLDMGLNKSNRNLLFKKFVHKWAKAWAAGDFSTYGALYSENFKSGGMTKTGWIKYKKKLSRIYKYIKVSVEDIKVSEKKGGVVLKFIQHYESDKFKVTGRKSLLLKQKDGNWQILKELWRKG